MNPILRHPYDVYSTFIRRGQTGSERSGARIGNVDTRTYSPDVGYEGKRGGRWGTVELGTSRLIYLAVIYPISCTRFLFFLIFANYCSIAPSQPTPLPTKCHRLITIPSILHTPYPFSRTIASPAPNSSSLSASTDSQRYERWSVLVIAAVGEEMTREDVRLVEHYSSVVWAWMIPPARMLEKSSPS
jgi:hypothetical protein